MIEKGNGLLLPKGWAFLTIANIVADVKNSIKRGPFGSMVKKAYFVPLGYKVYEQKNVIHNDFSLGSYCIDEKKFNELQGFELRPGDFVISCSGTIGKAAIVPEKIQRGIINQALLKLTLNNILVNSKYFYYLFMSDMMQKRLITNTRGTAITNIASVKALKKILFPIPPFNEQVRIVARLEEFFTRLDAAVEGLRKIRAQLKRYCQAVLKYAFEGKLTKEWRKTRKDQLEPAQKLLEQIKQERKNLEGNKYKELPVIDTKDLPELPRNWAWTRLGEVLFQSKDRFDPKSSQNERFIGLEHIERNTGKLLGYGESSETRSTKNKFKKGELLYGKLRPYLNKVYIAEFDGVCSTDILVFQKKELAENKFIAKLMLSNDFVKHMTQRMSGVQHPRVNYQTISNYVIPFPPLLEQQEIAGTIEQHFSIADEVEKLTEQTAKQAQQLRQSILKKAFEGKLVPQDPADEPAEKLLERIKEERARQMSKEGTNKIKRSKETLKEVGLMRYVE